MFKADVWASTTASISARGAMTCTCLFQPRIHEMSSGETPTFIFSVTCPFLSADTDWEWCQVRPSIWWRTSFAKRSLTSTWSAEKRPNLFFQNRSGSNTWSWGYCPSSRTSSTSEEGQEDPKTESLRNWQLESEIGNVRKNDFTRWV